MPHIRSKGKPEPNEKLVGFRMAADKYAALQRLRYAFGSPKTVAELINDALEAQYKLSGKRRREDLG